MTRHGLTVVHVPPPGAGGGADFAGAEAQAAGPAPGSASVMRMPQHPRAQKGDQFEI
jgi:hypothetical protein